MSLLFITLINIIIIFIAYVILNNKINKNSVPSLLERYTREVERLIVELNRAVDEVVAMSEEKMEELKGLIKQGEKIMKNPSVRDMVSASQKTKQKKTQNPQKKEPNPSKTENLLERTHHLLSMGYSKDEIVKILNINRAEVDFLESLNKK